MESTFPVDHLERQLSKSGRPNKLGETEKTVLRQIVEEKPTATLDEVTAAFSTRTGLSVHSATVRKGLREAGVRRKRSVPINKRQDDDTHRRYGYQSGHRRQLPEQDYPSSLTDEEWRLVVDLFENDGRGVPPRYSRRLLLDACCYVVRTGCAWRMLPSSFPPWQNVYRTFRRWAAAGKFEAMHDRLRQQWRAREGRDNDPSAGVLDAQSTRHSPQGGSSGYDAGKKVKGRKRNLVVDTLGLLLAVTITAASIQDRDAAPVPVAQARIKYPSLQTLFVDSGYAGQCAATLAHTHSIHVDVVRHPANRNVGYWHHPDQGELFPLVADSKGFVVLPKRWVVERTHGWHERARRLIMHHDRRSDVSEAWVWLTGARLLARRLTTA